MSVYISNEYGELKKIAGGTTIKIGGGGDEGGTTIILNATPVDIAQFYAPIESGSKGQVLQSDGIGKAPVWVDNKNEIDPSILNKIKKDLEDAIAAEATLRSSADEDLTQNILNEQTAREEAVNTLQTLIDGLQSNLDNEIIRATTAEATLNTYVDTTFLKKSGGQMEGPISFKDGNALPNKTNLQYVLGIDAFAAGGEMGWMNVSSLITSLGLSNYLPKSGGDMSGPIKIAAGDGQGINADGNFYINSASKTILGLFNGNSTLGHDSLTTLIRGSEITFNGKQHYPSISSSSYHTKKEFTLGPTTEKHLCLGGDGFQAMTNASTVGALYLNYYGGTMQVGSSGTGVTTTFYGEVYVPDITIS